MSDIDDIVRRHVFGTNDPAENIGVFISMNSAIVRELAQRGPRSAISRISGIEGCTDCSAPRELSGSRSFADPANHEPSCLWRRSKELYPNQEPAP